MKAKTKRGRVTEAEALQMHADYVRLKSLKQAAALHGRTFQSLYAILKYRGLIAKTKERALPRATIAAMFNDYLRLKSLAKTAKLWGRTRQNMWDILRRRFKLRTRKRHAAVTHAGRKYTPFAGGGDRGTYLRATVEPRVYLHYVIWETAHGPVPAGHEIGFHDGDGTNCALENLFCLPKREMRQRNATGTNQHTAAREARLVAGIENWIKTLAQRAARNYRMDDVEGLAQAGRVAALKAARTWKPGAGMNFMSWATMPIKGAMRRAATDGAHAVHVPANVLFTAGVSTVSMDAPVGAEEDGETFGNLFVSDAEGVTAAAVTGERAALLQKMLGRLPKREREILRRRFFEEHTLEQIGADLGVSRERVRQIEAEALATLRRSRNLKRLEAA